jgi:glycolate oxidase
MLQSRPDAEPPSPGAVEKAKILLERALGPSKLLTEPASCERFGEDDSEAELRIPDAVVLAENTDDILAALRVAREAGVPITPRSGGTGRTGGSVPVVGGIVLCTLGMNSIKEIDRKEGLCVVEPGVVLGDLHSAVEQEGLFYPPDANSLTTCALGGNVAENSGGPRAFKYGVTRDYVLRLEAFLLGGQRIVTGARTRKCVTGYDVTSLLVGSEGTLAVFGDITLRLIPKPESVMTVMILFPEVRDAAAAVEAITGAGIVPRCMELLDARTLQAVRDAGNPIDKRAGAMLLTEVDGDPRRCEEQAERLCNSVDAIPTVDILVAQDAAQRDRLWAARRQMSPSVRRLAKHKLSEDVVVPRQRMVKLLERVDATSERTGIQSVTYGHAGDGNLHVNYLWNDDDDVPKVESAIEQLFRDVVELSGTLSGEHGIGLMKAPYLGLEQSEDLIDLQRDIKRTFDPLGLLNPGKIFPRRGHGPC